MYASVYKRSQLSTRLVYTLAYVCLLWWTPVCTYMHLYTLVFSCTHWKSKRYSLCELFSTSRPRCSLALPPLPPPPTEGPPCPVISCTLSLPLPQVRALAWSHEVPWLALSGSWDGTLRMWDTRNGSTIMVMRDHHADIYAITSHPLRPNVFVSTSRDTTMRTW